VIAKFSSQAQPLDVELMRLTGGLVSALRRALADGRCSLQLTPSREAPGCRSAVQHRVENGASLAAVAALAVNDAAYSGE